MSLSQQDYDAFVIEGAKITQSEATEIGAEMDPEIDPTVEEGASFGTGLSISISDAAQKLRDMDEDQRTSFGSVVLTVVVTENPGGYPG